MSPRETRQLIALQRRTRQSQARLFLRCAPYMIQWSDEWKREEQLAQGKQPTLGKFGLRFILAKEEEVAR